MYESDNKERFPFTPDGYPTLPFLDFWTLMNPYIRSNRTFYLCPADKGPFNFVAVGVWGMGLSTNQLPFPNSYYCLPGLYSADDNFLSSETPRQRFLSEVKHPSQKFLVRCGAIMDKHSPQELPAPGWLFAAGHGTARYPMLFVDGRSSVVLTNRIITYPKITFGLARQFSPLDWADVP
jgi:hypothetical protein